MTAVVEPPQLLSVPPGWSTATNLLPPEILGVRRARIAARLVIIALTALSLLLVAAYAVTLMNTQASESNRTAIQKRTAALQQQKAQFKNVTALKSDAAAMSAELAKLMRTDANVAQLLKSITAALPPGAILSDVSMIMNSSGGTNRSGAASVGKPAVATMTLTGTAAHLADVAKFVDNLAAIPGVQAPFPGSDTVAPDGAHFNISLSLDTSVLSHRFDVKGAK